MEMTQRTQKDVIDMAKKRTDAKADADGESPAAKPISLAPLEFQDAVRAIAGVKVKDTAPPKS
ncbi:MAG: hypothetical protein WD711_00320 [Dongiaceae bacterium]